MQTLISVFTATMLVVFMTAFSASADSTPKNGLVQSTEIVDIPNNHADKAKELGYTKVSGQYSHGQAVYYRSKASSALKYITPDVDSHSGGYWKAASSVSRLGSKSTRSGTYDANLNRIGD